MSTVGVAPGPHSPFTCSFLCSAGYLYKLRKIGVLRAIRARTSHTNSPPYKATRGPTVSVALFTLLGHERLLRSWYTHVFVRSCIQQSWCAYMRAPIGGHNSRLDQSERLIHFLLFLSKAFSSPALVCYYPRAHPFYLWCDFTAFPNPVRLTCIRELQIFTKLHINKVY